MQGLRIAAYPEEAGRQLCFLETAASTGSTGDCTHPNDQDGTLTER